MQFDRFIKLVGKENFEKIKNLKILVVGVGGVGGYVVEALARCGVGTIIIIDPDCVEESNINRQVIATYETIGKKKVEVFQDRIQKISDQCQCISIPAKIDENNLHLLNDYHPDFIVDACDDITAKKMMISYIVENHLPFLASMGTGKRLDPSQLEITTLDKTNYDPLAKILRKYVREEQISSKITVLASKEQPRKTEGVEIASCSFVPAGAGLLIASYIIRSVIK